MARHTRRRRGRPPRRARDRRRSPAASATVPPSPSWPGAAPAGHVCPRSPSPSALVAAGPGPCTTWAPRGASRRLAARRGFDHTLLPGAGHPAPADPRQPRAPSPGIVGRRRRRRAPRRLRPRVVWPSAATPRSRASPPPAPAGADRGRRAEHPPGAANRLGARFAKASAVSFPGTPLPRAVVTGNPMRAEVWPSTARRPGRPPGGARHRGRPAARARRRRLAGARSINDADRAWRGPGADLAVRHVVGRPGLGRRSRRRPAGRPGRARLPAGRLRGPACRRCWPRPTSGCSGPGRPPASRSPPLGPAGDARPSPFVTGDHQTGNARWLADAGAAVLVPTPSSTAPSWPPRLDALLGDRERQRAMADAAGTAARPTPPAPSPTSWSASPPVA